jgi:non-lysosomal glucosylceramidase
MINNTLDLTLLNADAATLCTPGSAAEFIQPWYTPIETTPANTGIAIGGIGSTYTMTASATTPLINFLPGLHVEGEKTSDIRLQNWFASEREPNQDAALTLVDITKLRLYVTLFPIYRPDGSEWLTPEMSEEEVQSTINEMTDCLSFYDDNKAGFEAYKTELSPKTQSTLAENTNTKIATQLVLLDYFNGAVVTDTTWQASLSGSNRVRLTA